MKKIIFAILLSSFAATLPSLAADSSILKNDNAKANYALGVLFGGKWQEQGLTLDPQAFARAMKDVQSGKTLMTTEECNAFLQEYGRSLTAKLAEKNKTDGEAFLAKNGKEKGVVTLPDGLQYKIITEGKGEIPTPDDTVTVNYRGTLVDGKEFDSSYKRGQPATFSVSGVIPGWTEALEKMPVGSKWQLFIPANLAYGENGRPGIPPNSTLIFEVELLSAKAPPSPTSAAPQRQPLTSDIIKVPSAEEMKKGAKIETIKPEDLQKMQATNSAAK